VLGDGRVIGGWDFLHLKSPLSSLEPVMQLRLTPGSASAPATMTMVLRCSRASASRPTSRITTVPSPERLAAAAEISPGPTDSNTAHRPSLSARRHQPLRLPYGPKRVPSQRRFLDVVGTGEQASSSRGWSG